MRLPKEEGRKFFELMWSLMLFVNGKKNIVPSIKTLEDLWDADNSERILIRDGILEHPELTDQYIAENPDGFGQEDLETIRGWKNFKKGTFYIERHLKKHTIVIGSGNGGKQDQVYGIWSLSDALADMIPKQYLPTMARMVLLPFQGKIIYDGFLQGYNVHLGGGIRKELKAEYMRAKNTGRIITVFGDDNSLGQTEEAEDSEDQWVVKDWSDEFAQLKKIASKMRGGQGQHPVNSALFSLIKSSIEMAGKTIDGQADVQVMDNEIRKVERAFNKVDDIFRQIL